jgi:hypothetical protein
MENTVYLVLEDYDYEGSSVLSIHRSEANAIKAAEKLAVKSGFKKLCGQNAWRKWSTVEPFELQD